MDSETLAQNEMGLQISYSVRPKIHETNSLWKDKMRNRQNTKKSL